MGNLELYPGHNERRNQRILEGIKQIGALPKMNPKAEPFGYPRNRFENGLSFIGELTPESLEEIAERVTLPLGELTKRTGLSAIISGVGEMQPHLTLGNYTFNDANHIPPVADELTRMLSDHPFTNPIVFNDFVPGKNCTLGIWSPSHSPHVGQIEDFYLGIDRLREVVDTELSKSEHGVSGGIRVYKELIHVTVARMLGQSPDEFDPAAFISGALRLRTDLKRNPIELELRRIRLLPTIEAINTLSPPGVNLITD